MGSHISMAHSHVHVVPQSDDTDEGRGSDLRLHTGDP